MSEYAATTTAVRLKFEALGDFGEALTGITDLYARVWRDSDDFIFDWSDNTFKTPASVVTIHGILAEVNATYLAGWYARTLPVQPGGAYNVVYGQVGNTVANLVGAHDEIFVGRLAVPGDSMALTSGERTTVQALVLSDATPFPGASVDATISSRASASALAAVQTDADDIQTRLPAALISGRIDASVGAMAADVLTASAVATDAVVELQAGLATATEIDALPTAAENADAVWDEMLAGHAITGSAGAAAALVDVAVSSRATAAGVWATAEGTPSGGTFGYAMWVMRQWLTNRLDVSTTTSGQMILYGDNALPLLTWTLRDGVGHAITTPGGAPARRGAAA